jgi:hypothetical protein
MDLGSTGFSEQANHTGSGGATNNAVVDDY